MQDDITEAVREVKRRADALLAARVLTDLTHDLAGEIKHAMRLQASADAVVQAVVQSARERGATWQAIGDVLGVTRQAAFQRFGKPIDPRTGEPLNTTPLDGASESARAVIRDLADGRWQQVTDRFDTAMREGLPADALAAAWAQIVGASGAFEAMGEPSTSRAGDVTVTNTPLAMEAGDYTVRIAFRDDRTIAGLHILQEQAS